MDEKNPYLERVLAALDEIGVKWDELFHPPFKIQEVCSLLAALVQAAEAVITDPGSGEQKRKLVMDAWDYLDKKYQLLDHMDKLIRLPFFLEPFDQPILRYIVENVLIAQIVTVFNLTIWRKGA
jgi:chemotaxis regulatin CheY-phosphate phosphatase CheZ